MARDRFSKLGVEQILHMAIEAMKTKLPAEKPISVDGESTTVGDVVTDLEDIEGLYVEIRELHNKLHHLVARRRERHAQVVAYLQSLQATLISLFGARSDELHEFGFSPRKKPAPLTAEKRLVKAAKLRETRKLRHTMGRRQKEKIKATGPVVVAAIFPDKAPVVSRPRLAAALASSSRPGLDPPRATSLDSGPRTSMEARRSPG